MTPERREILERVARGELTPEEADSLLEDSHATPTLQPAAPASGIRRVKVSAGFGALVVTGDPTVTEAEIEGQHSASVEGDTLVVHGDLDPDEPGAFSINLGGRHRSRRVRFGSHQASSLRLRIHPSLELDAKLDAGPMSISGVNGPIRARAAAGPITIEDFGGVLDVSVNAGAVRVTGKIVEGDSRLRTDAGSIRVELDPTSSVHIMAEAALGKVLLPGFDEGEKRRFGSRRKATIGDGKATLRVDTAMGSIHISTT